MTTDKLLLVGCGILRKEILCLVEKNRWPVDTLFLDSSLHCDLEALARALRSVLAAHRHRDVVVFYGRCHPHMERILAPSGACRTEGVNCIDMLLGGETSTEELAEGAFFLLEDWADTWEDVMHKALGTTRPEVVRDIVHSDRRYLLGIRTPCSGDFSAAAERAGTLVDLPLRWRDVPLDRLESVLQAAITRRLEHPR